MKSFQHSSSSPLPRFLQNTFLHGLHAPKQHISRGHGVVGLFVLLLRCSLSTADLPHWGPNRWAFSHRSSKTIDSEMFSGDRIVLL